MTDTPETTKSAEEAVGSQTVSPDAARRCGIMEMAGSNRGLILGALLLAAGLARGCISEPSNATPTTQDEVMLADHSQ